MRNEIYDRGSELCISCGLCCSGAMFEEVYVNPEEIEAVRDAGLTPVINDGSLAYIPLPCASHYERKCMIYTHRFFRCKGYKCKLLENYLQGQVSFELASSHILKSVLLYEKLRNELGLMENHYFWQSIRDLWRLCPEGNVGQEFRRKHAMLLLEILAFIQLLGKHFFDNGDERWLILKTGFKL